MDQAFVEDIFKISDHRTFRATALEVFHYQAKHTPVYRDYLAALGADPSRIKEPEEIPFLPIEFFKSHTVIGEGKNAEVIFESSGTTGTTPSRHHVADTGLYRESFTRGFRKFYGDPGQYCILALLPSYLERKDSSLVHMMEYLIGQSGHPESGFYLDDLEELASILKKRNEDRQPTLLVGVSFALLDLAERYPLPLGSHITVMETGGMKGRRKEMIRGELHAALKEAFGVSGIHSEYGMTELLSQAYSGGEGRFRSPPWMKVLVRDPNDPLSLLSSGQSGGINIIDLANIYSCSFIATGDLGKVYDDGSFEVLGRYDHSDIRGCNLLIS
ncbi:MAG: acyltransferase [Bacteroidales bacterium]|nr:acyltransferase [Bacteroidales bacterium]